MLKAHQFRNLKFLMASVLTTLALSSCVLNSPLPAYKATLPPLPDKWIEENKSAVDVLVREGKSPDTSWFWLSEDTNEEIKTLLEEAIENNPELLSAQARLDQKVAQHEVSQSSLFPQIDLLGNASRTKSSSKGFEGQRVKSYKNSFKLESNISWEIDLWGRLRSATEASYLDLDQQRIDLEFAKLSLATQVVQKWIELTALSQQEEISRQQQNNLERIVGRTRDRYREGLGSIIDLRLAETDLLNAQATLILKINKASEVSKSIEVMLGRYPKGSVTSDFNLPIITTNYDAGIPSDLLLYRPDLIIAEKKILAANHRVNEAQANRLPRLTLTQSTIYQDTNLKDIFDPANLIASVAGGLIEPIYDGGRRKALVAQSKAVEDEAVADFKLKTLNAFLEVESGLRREFDLQKQESEIRNATKFAEESEELSRQKYFNGLIPILDLLQAQQRLFISRSRLVNIRKQRLLSRVGLYLALGGQNISLDSDNPDQIEQVKTPSDNQIKLGEKL